VTTQPPDPTPDTPASQTTSPQPDPPTPETNPETDTTAPLRTRRPGWRKPPSSPDAVTDAGSEDAADSAETSDEQLEQPSTKTGSSRGSSRAERKAIREGIRAALVSVTGLAHQRLARDEYDQAVALYVADDQDAEEISKPASSLIARRMGPGIMSPDIADGIALGIAVAGYVSKQVQRWLYARQLRAAGATLHAPDADTATGSTPPPPPPTAAPVTVS
jgi:hypothetical protein